MSEKSTNEIFTEATVEASKEIIKEAYGDIVHPTAKAVGGFFGTLAGFFSNVVVYPLKKLNIEYEQKAIAFEREMQKKYNNIPENMRCEPELHIIGPAMEALKYNILEDELAEMFSNLLISDMDKETQSYCSTAFVKVIEQLSPIDARVLKSIWSFFKIPHNNYQYNDDNIYIGRAERIHYFNENESATSLEIPTFLLSNFDIEINKFELSKSVINLERLGILNFSFFEDMSRFERDLKKILNASHLYIDGDVSMMKHYIELNNQNIFAGYYELKQVGFLILNDFGKSFVRVCFRGIK